MIRRLGARSVPLPNGNLTMPRMAGGATASYVGEGADAKATGANFDDVKLSAKTMITIVPMSNQLIGTAGYNVEQLVLGDLTIDQSRHEVRRGDDVVPLTPLEFDLLVALARAPWRVFTREELLEQVWGYRHAADTRLVNVHVQRLRSKIERDAESPSLVITVRGVGYRAGTGS